MYIIYDGVENSVFQSVVLAPLLHRLEADSNLEITLVSFESRQIPAVKLMRLVPAHDRLHFVLLRKTAFIGKIVLWFGVLQLYRLLGRLPCHHIITRGPLAGWIAMHTLRLIRLKRINHQNGTVLPSLVVQARGLCAEEYRYTHVRQKYGVGKSVCCYLMYRSLLNIEREVFGGQIGVDFAIEAVSQALKEYLVRHFQANHAAISVASWDIPQAVPGAQVSSWRQHVRKSLKIDENALVYCYSGSFKPWQCAEETIKFFAEKYQKDPRSFLLILSQDKDLFIRVLEKCAIPRSQYRVISIGPRHLLEYLSAADIGLLFREPDVINWVSRPTKLLEYQAVGLRVVHNNTVACLVS